MAVSLSFMLPIGKFYLFKQDLSELVPVATPPNAMIYATGNMRTKNLLIAGFVMKLIGIIVIFVISLALVAPVFNIHEITIISNSTLTGNATSG